MKKIDELAKNECQDFLNETFKDENIEFSRLIFEPDFSIDETCGIEYSALPENKKYIVSFSNPEFLIWLYKHDYDLLSPLRQLEVDYTEIDETNSILFEFVMNVNKVINDYSSTSNSIKDNEKAFLEEMGPIFADDLNKIKNLQKELISKL